jgi:drug/metabolite transporter (DMT)-like permease
MALAPELAAVAFGLFASLSWGVSDFSGGMATKRISVIGVVAVSNAIGLLLLIGLAFAAREMVPPVEDFVWGAFAGLAGLVGIASLYQALAVGQMGVAAPLSAVLSAVLSVGFGILIEGLPAPSRLVGFGLGVASIWFVSYSRGAARETKGLGFAALAGVGFAAFLVFVDRVSEGAVFWPLVAARATSSAVMLSAAFFSRRRWTPQGRVEWTTVLLAGLLDVAGNIFFVMSTQVGRLDVAAVVSSLYPAITVLLARFILKERITRLQALGLGAALAAISLIAIG